MQGVWGRNGGTGPIFCTLLCRAFCWFPFLADLGLVYERLVLWLHCYSCVRFAVVHPSVHGNDPDAERALHVKSSRPWGQR